MGNLLDLFVRHVIALFFVLCMTKGGTTGVDLQGFKFESFLIE